MLIDLEPVVISALRKDPELIALLGRDSKGNTKVYPLVAPDISLPKVTFFELTNFDNQFAGDKALSSAIHFQVDVWHNSNTSKISSAVNRVMESLGFVRSGVNALYEDDTKIYHKVLRYKKTQLGS
ncbi:tail completion protein gp17 [Paenibacillus amylolyticus]|uniref:tail completion protein gp17 n=1 Tax=Paenibacillus amylolyticus TaxID=1451 RepID=UPI003D9728FF